MMQARNHDRLSAGGAHKAGWLVSIGLHGSLVLGALALLQQMHLALQPEPFEWDVAMVQPTTSQSPAAAANESPPSPPSPTRPPVPVQRLPAPVPAQPLPSSVVPAPAPPIPAPTTPPRAEPAPPPPMQAALPSKPEPTTEPTREEPRPQPPAPVKSDEPPPKTSVADIPTAARSAEPPEQPSASIPPSTATSAPEPAPVSPEPVRAQVEAPHQATPAPNMTTETSTAVDHPAAPATTEVAALTSPSQSSTAKPDDGWLSELMGKWIADLEKHYPAALRLEGVQGKVVLVAMLHENGTLTDVKVARSSGNTVLDQAAIADVEQGPPIKLSRPLGRPQRPIKFSISYDLKTAR